MTALVMDCNYNGLAIIQSLGKRGVPVYALDTVRSVGTFSRYASHWVCPDPMTSERQFVRFLLEKASCFPERPVVFPTNDEWALVLARHKDILNEKYILCVADWPVVDLLTDKEKFYAWGERKGYPTPRMWPIENQAGISGVTFPAAVKPKCRRVAGDHAEGRKLSGTLARHRLTVVPDRLHLDRFLDENQSLLPLLLLQEYVAGLSDRMYTAGVYVNRRHEVIGMFTGRKVRGFPPDFGDCVIGQSEPLPAVLKDLVRQMCRDLGFQGIAEFEFKQDARSGEFRLIEINPRSWSWIGITPACGVNLPWIAYEDLQGRGPLTCQESTMAAGAVKWVKPVEDFRNCLSRNRKSGFPEWHMGLWQWICSLRGGRLVLAGMDPRDPVPALFALWPKLVRGVSGLLRRIGMGAGKTPFRPGRVRG